MNALIVMAHKGTEECLQRHLPFFKRSGADVLIGAGPNDGMIWPPGFDYVICQGTSERIGKQILGRLVALWKFLSWLDFDHCCIIEYDMLILKPIEEWPTFGADIFPNTDAKFKSDKYYLPPWFMDRPTLKAMTDAGIRALAEDDIELGYTDRFMGLLAKTLGIEVAPVKEVCTRCFYLDHSLYSGARELVSKGELRFLHTIKTETELRYMLGESDNPI